MSPLFKLYKQIRMPANIRFPNLNNSNNVLEMDPIGLNGPDRV